MTQELKNTPEFRKNMHAIMGLPNPKPLTPEQKKQIKQNLYIMYAGLVSLNWANGENVKLGTAQYKALQQMKSFAETLKKDKSKNSVVSEIFQEVADLKKSVSKQIMESKYSDLVLDKQYAPTHKKLGAKFVSTYMGKLREMVKHEQVKNNDTRDQSVIKPNQKIVLKMLSSKNSMQYAA